MPSKAAFHEPQRSLAVDLFKTAAAFRVVMVHLAPVTVAAEALSQLFQIAAVPFFLLIAVYFFIRRVAKLKVFKFSELHRDRILVPYAVWTLIYVLMRMLKFHLNGESFPVDWIAIIFFGGGALQLYFLPLLLLFQAEALALILIFRGGKQRWIGLAVALGAIGFGSLGSLGNYFGFEGALEKGLAYVAMAFLLGHLQTFSRGRKINLGLSCLSVVFIASMTFFGRMPVGLGIFQGPLVAYGVAVLALNWRLQIKSPLVVMLLGCSYAIYLAHFAFLESFEFAADRLGYALTPYSVPAKLSMSLLICLCCILLFGAAQKHWLPAYLFFGEWRGRPRRLREGKKPRSERLEGGEMESDGGTPAFGVEPKPELPSL